MKSFVTGGAGFIGSHVVERLLARGDDVVAYDNFSTGQETFLEAALRDPRCTLVRGDLLDNDQLSGAMLGCERVFHLAANADIRFGLERPRRDLEQNTIATFNVLEAMRAHGVRQMVFSSTGSVYGEPSVFPTPENAPFPVQTSLYAASKVAGEGMIQAFSEGWGMQAWIFRFVSILGERYTHGHVFDFVKQLREHPDELLVLGDGTQRKSYLYVHDCVDAIFHALEHARERVNVLNLGTDEYCAVTDSIGWITQALGVQPKLVFSGGARGWVGDSPFIFLDCSRMRALGWKPKLAIREAVCRTVQFLQNNPWVLESRA